MIGNKRNLTNCLKKKEKASLKKESKQNKQFSTESPSNLQSLIRKMELISSSIKSPKSANARLKSVLSMVEKKSLSEEISSFPLLFQRATLRTPMSSMAPSCTDISTTKSTRLLNSCKTPRRTSKLETNPLLMMSMNF